MTTKKFNKPKSRAVVLDTAALIAGTESLFALGGIIDPTTNTPLQAPGPEEQVSFYTTPDVIREVRDARARARLALLDGVLIIRPPSSEALTAVTAFARATGDYSVLSLADLRVIALCWMLEMERDGGSCLRSIPERTSPSQIHIGKIITFEEADEIERKEQEAEQALRQANDGWETVSSKRQPNANRSKKKNSPKPTIRHLDNENTRKASVSMPAPVEAIAAIIRPPQQPSSPCQPNDQCLKGISLKSLSGPTHDFVATPSAAGEGLVNRSDDGIIPSTKVAAETKIPASQNARRKRRQRNRVVQVEHDKSDNAKSFSKNSHPQLTQEGRKPVEGTSDASIPEPRLSGDTIVSIGPVKNGKPSQLATSSKVQSGDDDLDALKDKFGSTAQSKGEFKNMMKSFNGIALQAADELEVADVPTGEDITPSSEGEVESDSDSDDGVGWINPDNLDEHLARDASQDTTTPEDASRVGCVTTDFAMQNTMLQMGLKILTVDGRRTIRKIKHFALRCHSCGTVTRELELQFCDKCGNAAMHRVAFRVNKNGVAHAFLNPKKGPFLRGTKYSIPNQQGGRHNNDLILRADQIDPVQQRRLEKQRERLNVDVFDPSTFYNAGKRYNPNDKPLIVGYGRRNPNAVRPCSGRRR